MDRIAQAFARARSENRAAFVAYLCAGDPDFDTSLAACRALIESGTDILELGVPFSDPLADGLTNQLAAQRALESGITAARVLELVRKIREFSQVPIVFYTYYNLVFANGVEAYVRAAKLAGVDGILTLDLPPEEAGEVMAACKAEGVKTVFIVAPTTPEARLPQIGAAASGFIYYVSREGVTGVRDQVALSLHTDFENGKPNPPERQTHALDAMLDGLVRWAGALKPLRDGVDVPAEDPATAPPPGRRVSSM